MSVNLLDAVRELQPRVRELAPEAESGRRLPVELADAFGGIGLWRACAPSSVGGLELPLADQLVVFEEVARADGSVGWCAMIGATSSIIYAYLEPEVARSLISAAPAACTGGVFAPSGRAVQTDGGLRVSGRWAFGSGVQHSSRMGLGVVVMDGDVPRTLDSGAPDIRAVIVDDFEVIDTWTVSGLKGTGSHDVAVDDVFVPSEHVYRLVAGRSHQPGPLYTFPIFGLLGLGVASVCLGVARSAMDELIALAGGKTPTGSRRRLADRGHIQMEVASAEAELRSARAFMYQTVEEAWNRANAGDEASLEDRAMLRLAATNAARTSARVVDRMYEAGGGTSVYATSRLQRDFRDVHAATQHMVVASPTLELAGRVLLGVETDVSQL